MTKYNTNLASEFYVLSVLYRMGHNASLTLGNKKSVDIIVIPGKGEPITIDVKGLAGKTSWPVDNVDFEKVDKNHFLIFVSYLDKITDPLVLPEVYIVPLNKLKPFVYISPKKDRKVLPLSRLRKDGSQYKDAWHLLK